MNPMTMNRSQLIEALRGHTPPTSYQQITRTYPTARLRGLLAFYLSSEADKKPAVTIAYPGENNRPLNAPRLTAIVFDELVPVHFIRKD